MTHVLHMYKVLNRLLYIYRKSSVFTYQGRKVVTSRLFASAVDDAFHGQQGKPSLLTPDPEPAEPTPVCRQ